MGLHFSAYGLLLLIIATSIPMVLGMVRPNRWYGFRTGKTLSSPGIWYPANRFSGWLMLLSGFLALCFNLTLWHMHPEWESARLKHWYDHEHGR